MMYNNIINTYNNNATNYEKALLYCKYLLYYYTSSRYGGKNYNNAKLFLTRLYQHLGDIYHYGARNKFDILNKGNNNDNNSNSNDIDIDNDIIISRR